MIVEPFLNFAPHVSSEWLYDFLGNLLVGLGFESQHVQERLLFSVSFRLPVVCLFSGTGVLAWGKAVSPSS